MPAPVARGSVRHGAREGGRKSHRIFRQHDYPPAPTVTPAGRPYPGGMNSGTSRTSSSGGGSNSPARPRPRPAGPRDRAARGAAPEDGDHEAPEDARPAPPSIRSTWAIIREWIIWTSRSRRSALERSESPISRRLPTSSSPSVRTSLAAVRASRSRSRARCSASLTALAAASVASLTVFSAVSWARCDDRPGISLGGGLHLLGGRFDLLGVGATGLAQSRGLRLGHLDDLRRFLLGGLHAVVRCAVALGDPVAHALLGVPADPLGGFFGRGDDCGNALGRGSRARATRMPGCQSRADGRTRRAELAQERHRAHGDWGAARDPGAPARK